jgi:hypothetical protein
MIPWKKNKGSTKLDKKNWTGSTNTEEYNGEKN